MAYIMALVYVEELDLGEVRTGNGKAELRQLGA
jgi:hypothetical protein